jgi:Asp-tRNA(Asn)/Glu-tRNA(Gln) amidotransferase A subunit family amidase
MDAARLAWLPAAETARLIAGGAISAEDHVRACLAQIGQTEPTVQAWEHLDPDSALEQAREADDHRRRGLPCGPLHGVAIGIKDIIDVRGLPTGDGSVLHAGRIARRDATVVGRLRAAGAVILGKTVTTEMATYAPGRTRNPHDPEHTPGGSSSGSAAAVAAGMVPVALGSQTNGSIIRPASYCGVYGFKPSFGLVPRGGVLTLSRALDHVGVLARSLEDLALVTECIAGFAEDDADTLPPRARPPLSAVLAQEPPLPPKLALVRTPFWDRLDADARATFDELAQALGDRADTVELPPEIAEAVDWHRTVFEADLAANFEPEYERGADRLSASLRGQIERGRRVPAIDYLRALARIAPARAGFDELLGGYDAIVTPATLGTAPKGLDSTGDPLPATLWTYCGMPALSLPLARGENGLPLGVQLVGRYGDDARLLRTARWLCAVATEEQDPPPAG